MPLKAFCDNCKKELDPTEPQPYGIVFILPGTRFQPKHVEKMLCQECFVSFYEKAGFNWSNVDKITNGKQH